MTDTEEKVMNEEELLRRVEQAARQGAKEGSKGHIGGNVAGAVLGWLLSSLLPIVLALFLIAMAGSFMKSIPGIGDFFNREEPVADHDLTLENNGPLGYLAADFSEAVLGKAEHLAKMEVYSREVSDITTLTEAGIGNLKIFTKYQLITYKGTATYVVDLRQMKEYSIEVNNDTQTVTLYIPHTELNPINISSEDMEFGDVNRGILALGDLKATPEAMAQVETEAKAKMAEKLEAENTIQEADRFARLTVLELYQPVIKSVAGNYSVEVKFAD